MDAVPGGDWKEKLGFPINYDSGQSSDADDTLEVPEVVRREVRGRTLRAEVLLEDGGDGATADLLGTTPPRAVIRNKEKRRTVLISENNVQKKIKDVKRKNFDSSSNVFASDISERVKRRESLKHSRSKDRDQKMMDSSILMAPPGCHPLVDSSNRFMSLSSKLKCCQSQEEADEEQREECLPTSRVQFHKTFSLLINMGNVEKGCKRMISREEQVWQNELKDLIWLELQARLAGRSPARQDQYLCMQRALVPVYVRNIMEYRFVNKDPCKKHALFPEDLRTDVNATGAYNSLEEWGCLTLECPSCSSAVGRGLRETGALVDAFYNAVALYPSSKAMTLEHKLIATQLFQNRLKAMCLWYNMALHMRLLIVAVRSLVRTIQKKYTRFEQMTSVESDYSVLQSERNCKVRFADGNPSDSNNSDESLLDVKKETEQKVEEKEEKRDIGQSVEEKESVIDEKMRDDGQSESPAVNNKDQIPTTPEIVIGSQYGTTDTNASEESGYTSERSTGDGDPYDLGPLDELTELTLLNRCQTSPYRQYLNHILKTRGVRRSMMFIQKMRKNLLRKVYHTFQRPETVGETEKIDEESSDIFAAKEEEEVTEEVTQNTHELVRYGCWSPESRAMRLPSYRNHFLLLSTCSMEVVHDYLALCLDRSPKQPCCLTIKQLIHELKEGIDIATEIRSAFVKNIEVAIAGFPAEPSSRDPLLLIIRTFDTNVENVLKQYLSYLRKLSAEEVLSRSYLETEWRFVAGLAGRLKWVCQLAPEAFTDIACNQLDRQRRQIELKFSDLFKKEEDFPHDSDDVEMKRQFVFALCRETQALYAQERESMLQSVQFARALQARLAPARVEHRDRIFKSLIAIRECVVTLTASIVERSYIEHAFELERTLGEGIVSRLRELLLHVFKIGFELHKELYGCVRRKSSKDRSKQRPTSLQPPQRNPGLVRRRPETIVIHESLPLVDKELHKFAATAVNKPCLVKIGSRARSLRADSAAEDVDYRLFGEACPCNDGEKKQSSIELLLTGGNPENDVEVRLRPSQTEDRIEEKWAEQVARSIIEFAKCWMSFVMKRCDRGRGLRPRWASHGLEFLMLACDPYNTKYLSDEEFENLTSLMDACISHVIGSRPPRAPHSPAPLRRHRKLSPAPPNFIRADEDNSVPTPPTPPIEPDPLLNFQGDETTVHSRRVLEATRALDQSRDKKLREVSAVGRPLERPVDEYEPKLRQVTFKWQRGLKIGAGTFGKVYTVINLDTSQLLAMKEVCVAATDRRAWRRAANELRVLEGVAHPHLVTYYGVELHREQLLIFMELCVEGSLDTLVSRGALPETAVRDYTGQLCSAVRELHARKIVHRDIKSGNIFLTNEGRCLKLGDFGCAVKIRGNTTAVGELLGAVGTQAYMAPEVFMKSSGYGRAADVWSLGCVVTEMASGKRPFSEYDSNYQIMFVVGMGGRPDIPPSLSDDGRNFCEQCLTHEPEKRPCIDTLSTHHFLMIKSDDD